jgi:uncharacterized protein (TIGR02246 family)
MDTRDRQIEQLVTAAQQHQNDLEPFLALHTPDTVIVNFVGRRVLGADALREAMSAALGSPLADVTNTVEIQDIRYLRGDVAIVSCAKHVVDARDSGEQTRMDGSLTYVVVRDDDTWRIALAQTTPVGAPI